MKLSILSDKRKASIVDWLDTMDRLLPDKRRIRLQEWILDFAEHELFAAIWTFLFASIFTSFSHVLLTLLFGETYATVGVVSMVSLFATMLFIFIFFPKSETEETVKEILTYVQELEEEIAIIKRNVQA